MVKFTRSARRAVKPLLEYLVEDLHYGLLDKPRHGKGGHPMYRRLTPRRQRDMVRLMKWLLAQAQKSESETKGRVASETEQGASE